MNDLQSDEPSIAGLTDPTQSHRYRGLRAVLLLIGAAGMSILSVWIGLLDYSSDGGFVLAALDDGREVAHLPIGLVLGVLGGIVLGGVGLVMSVMTDSMIRSGGGWVWRWARSHPWWSLLIGFHVVVGSIDLYELFYDAYHRKQGLRVWMLREDLQVWLGWGAALLVGVGLLQVFGGRGRLGGIASRVIDGLDHRPGSIMFVAVITPVVLGGGMCLYALDGVPHFADSLTYLMQGRIVHSGRMWIDSPQHIDLFQHSLFFVETDGRFYGKYPIGWPLILGLFDRFHIGYLANAVLAGFATLLTGLVAKEFASKRVAVLAGVLFGLSPWVWFNGANFASHVASTCAVMGFMWQFLRTLEDKKLSSAVFTGLFLGAGVIIRPFDAAMFSLPVAGVILWHQYRDPKRWIVLGGMIAVGALVGVAVYLWSNAQTTGSARTSPYALEGRWDDDWSPTPLSMLSRFLFQWVELNGRFPGWGVGGITVGILGGIVAGGRWRAPGLRILAASTGLFFMGCCAFGFTNVWWGPRWLLPVVPLLAILGAEFVDQMIVRAAGCRDSTVETWEDDPGPVHGARLGIGILFGGMLIALVGRYPGQIYQLRAMPPHSVSSTAHEEVTGMGLDQAVVGMPLGGGRAPLDARAGMIFMDVPFETNRVIYVRAIPGWKEKATRCYPRRTLYELYADTMCTKGFGVRPVEVDRDRGGISGSSVD